MTFNGDGKLFSQDGSIEKEGYWENGKLVNKKTDKEKTLEKIKISSENKFILKWKYKSCYKRFKFL